MELDTFYDGDCIDVLGRIPDESVDLVVTSPPYADCRKYQNAEASIAPDDYVEWFLPRAEQIRRVLKSTGSFILNISDRCVKSDGVRGGYQHLYAFELLIALCRKTGFHLARDYIWRKKNAIPDPYSKSGMGRTKKSHEYCFWLVKGKEWTFKIDDVLKPYTKRALAYIERNPNGKEYYHATGHHMNHSKPWKNRGGADPGSVLDIAVGVSNAPFYKICRAMGITHPAMFPEKLAEFFIIAGSSEGDVVLDPFSGSGTTAAVAHRLGRHYIGIDISGEYNHLARERIRLQDEKTQGK